MGASDQVQVAARSDVLAGDRVSLAGRVMDSESIDQERHAIEQRVEEERDRPDDIDQLDAEDRAESEARECRGLEPGRRPATQRLVAGSPDGEVAEDRRDARGAGRAFQDPRSGEDQEDGRRADDQEERREPGQDHGHGSEDRAEEHDAVVAVAVSHHAEDR